MNSRRRSSQYFFEANYAFSIRIGLFPEFQEDFLDEKRLYKPTPMSKLKIKE